MTTSPRANEIGRTSRWTVRRRLVVRRWRIVAVFRLFRGNGLSNFEFEFRFGFPRHSPDAASQIEEVFPDDERSKQ